MSDVLPPTDPIDAQLARLAALHPKKIDLSLDRMRRILARLGHPERRAPPVIHVAGTNGKGSTVAFCRACLEAAGYRVHVYTSPHLVRFHERIRLAGKLIDDALLIEVLRTVEDAAAGEPITYFEVTTAAAFLAFAQVKADALILEVGLGGRLDATNIIDKPIASIITKIALDHQQFLGDSLGKIAREKLGVAKPGAPLVTAQNDPMVKEVIERGARDIGAKLLLGGRDWSAQASGDKLLYQDKKSGLVLPKPKLPGEFQCFNAGLAIAALRHQKTWQVPPAAFKAGLGWASWPARLQRLAKGPLADLLPKGAVLWLDGGHNADAAQALAQYFKNQVPAERRLHLVAGMMANRNPADFLKPFAGQAASVHGVPIKGEDSHSSADIAAAASQAGMSGRMAGDVRAALRQIALQHADGPPPVVLICGSLYLAGQVLADNGTPPA